MASRRRGKAKWSELEPEDDHNWRSLLVLNFDQPNKVTLFSNICCILLLAFYYPLYDSGAHGGENNQKSRHQNIKFGFVYIDHCSGCSAESMHTDAGRCVCAVGSKRVTHAQRYFLIIPRKNPFWTTSRSNFDLELSLFDAEIIFMYYKAKKIFSHFWAKTRKWPALTHSIGSHSVLHLPKERRC